jgi:phosphoglycolate phosphatase
VSVRAIIFDLDGTLLDTRVDVTTAYRTALEEHSLDEYAIDDCSHLIGGGPRAGMSVLLTRGGVTFTDQLLDSLVAAFAQHYCYTETTPYPGIDRLLATLGQRGIKLAVLSNKPHDAAKGCVRRFFAESLLGVVRGYRSERDKKPNPYCAKLIADELACPYPECMIAGDTVIDMETARAASMVPVAVAWGYGGDKLAQWVEEHNVQVLNKPEDLVRCL